MRHRARKEWKGGIRPEPSEADQALIDHQESCDTCKASTVVLTTCEEGRKLYAAFQSQFDAENWGYPENFR